MADKDINGTPVPVAEFIFIRELSEVYLLLDFISGRSDKSLTNGTSQPALTPHSAASLDGLGVDLALTAPTLKDICDIAFSPGAEPVARARQAAMLISAKDRLNAAARPASGQSIGFTVLAVGEDNRSRAGRLTGHKEYDGGIIDAEHKGSRMSLARLAFPGMVDSAERFGGRVRTIVWGLLVCLAITCILSMYVAAGTAFLTRLDQLGTVRAALSQKIVDAEVKANAALDNGKTCSAVTGVGCTLVRYCGERDEPKAPATQGRVKPRSIEEYHLCNQQERLERQRERARIDVRSWLWPWKDATMAQGAHVPSGPEIHAGSDEQLARIVVLVIGASVLPLLYGILGAGVAVVRQLWCKMRESLLSPRDFTLALQQLALGATVGACIGLFFPVNAASAGESGPLGAFTLSGSALSFLAGFCVVSVFMALESFVRRLFSTPEPGEKKHENGKS
jgi:hypothetical protein